MARPRKTGLDYFPHDVDATTDPKLEPAIMRFGAAAYAFYFVHLEYCYRSEDLSIDVSATETGQEMREVIQRKLQITEQEYDSILNSLLRHGAFNQEYYQETGKLTSDGIKKRASKVLEKRARASGLNNREVSAAETMSETPQRKVKQSKEEKSKEVPPKSPTGDADSAQGENVTVKIARGSGKDKPVDHSKTLVQEQFAKFWEKYPKKVGKAVAEKAWKKLSPDEGLFDQIMDALCIAVRCDQWHRDGGQFIPNPATWLNQRRWEDELTIQVPEDLHSQRTYDINEAEAMDFLELFPESGGDG